MEFRKSALLLVALVFLGASNLLAQEQAEAPKYGWENTILGNLNFSQSSFSNWAQGGENNWAWQLDLNGKFENKQEKYDWTTNAKVSYGRTKVGDQQSKKSADEIRMESVLTWKAGKTVHPYIAFTGETQLTKGYDFSTDPKTVISQFLDPGYFTESIGLGFEPFKDCKTRFGAALKQTVANDFASRYSDDPATTDIEKVRSEVGIESVSDFSRKVSENILFTTKLELFSDLSTFEEVDVRWDNVFSAKVSKYIGVSFNFKLLYDRDISLSRQIKQVLGVGLSYTFL